MPSRRMEESMKRTLAAISLLLCSFAVSTSVAAAVGPEAGGPGTLWAIITIFLWGMALNLTPCVYPLIPVTISYFSSKSIATKPARGSIVLNALVYVLGIAVMNSFLGVFAALSGRLLGSVLENPATLVLVALVMCLFALSMFGVWEFRLPAAITGAAVRNYAGFFGSFFMGLTLGIVAAPCIGPFVASILMVVAKRGDPVFGFWIFFSMSLGMGFPLFILGSLSGRLTMLPKSGEWMLWVRKLMGWVMLVAAAYFVRPIMPLPVGLALIAVVAAAAGVHLGWINRTGVESRVFGTIKKVAGVVCILLAVAIARLALPTEGVEWTNYSENVLSEAKASGRPVIVDFYADWCPACRLLDRITFHERSVIEAARKGFIMIRVDFTRRGDHAKEDLARSYGVYGIPTVIFLKPGGDERTDLRVMDAMPPDTFLTRMNDLKDGAGVQ